MKTKKISNKKTQHDLPAMDGPGVAPRSITEIDDAADDYVEKRDKRMALTVQEKEAKTLLLATVKKHRDTIGVDEDGVTTYRYDSQIVTLAPVGEKIKVKNADEDAEVDEDDTEN